MTLSFAIIIVEYFMLKVGATAIVGKVHVGKIKSTYEPKWLIRPELIPVSVALSD